MVLLTLIRIPVIFKGLEAVPTSLSLDFGLTFGGHIKASRLFNFQIKRWLSPPSKRTKVFSFHTPLLKYP